MGLYDNRLAELDAARDGGRVDQSRSRRPRMDVQALLFDRASWTASAAKAWAKSHGYKFGKVHVTDQHIRIRQFDPKDAKVFRTIPFGRGIRAVVAREEDMAKRRRRSSTKAAPRRARRRTREAAEAPMTKAKRKAAGRKAARTRKRHQAERAAAARKGARKRRRSTTTRRRRRVRETPVVRAPRRRRRAASAGYMMEAPRRRRRARRAMRAEAPRRRRKSRHAFAYEAPRRRRRRHARETSYAVAAPRRRRYRAAEGRGSYVAQLAVAVISGGLGFVLADGLDRFLATYNPASTSAPPTDKFTSSGAGTLANALNVASAPGLVRIGASVASTALPAIASVFVDQPLLRSALEGWAVGAGVKTFSMLWNNLLMPLLKPKDTSSAGLQKSFIARLYPAEVAASVNRAQSQTSVSSSGSGALSGAQAAQPGVGAPDVGPFALSAESPYETPVEALRRQAGMGNSEPGVPGVAAESPYPTAVQALRQEAGVGDIFSDLTQMLPHVHPQALHECAKHIHARHGARMPHAPGAYAAHTPAPPVIATRPLPPQPASGVSQPPAYEPGPPTSPGPGPQGGRQTDCGCMGDDNPFLGFVGGVDSEEQDVLYSMPKSGKAA